MMNSLKRAGSFITIHVRGLMYEQMEPDNTRKGQHCDREQSVPVIHIIKHFLHQACSPFTVRSSGRMPPPCDRGEAGRAEWKGQGGLLISINTRPPRVEWMTYSTHLLCYPIGENSFYFL